MSEVRNSRSRIAGVLLTCAAMLFIADTSHGQMLHISSHRPIAVPDYAILKIGPFYSAASFSQSAGYRYSVSSGNGTDFLFNNDRGVIQEDGSDIPMVSSLDLRNYLLISRNMDMDMSVNMSYYYFPLGTQDDEFNINLAEEGIIGDLSTEFIITELIKGVGYDRFVYKTDYIDTRGLGDRYGGAKYTYFNNVVGVNLDWLMAEDKNLVLTASREDNIPEDDAFDNQKRESYNESVAYEQQFEFYVAGVRAGYNQNSYPDATNRPDSSSQDYSVYTRVRLTERSMGAASIGYSMSSISDPVAQADTADSDETSDGNMIGSASVSTELSKALTHAFSVSRSQRAGFDSAFEVYDSYGYNLAWKGDMASASLFSSYSTVDPRFTDINGYTDWASGVNATYPVYADLPGAEYINLQFSSVYDIRSNETPVSPYGEPESVSDYNTWTTRLGASMPFFYENLTFSASVEHIARTSENTLLEYSRDVFEASIKYTHRF